MENKSNHREIRTAVFAQRASNWKTFERSQAFPTWAGGITQRQYNEVVRTGGPKGSCERYHRYRKSLGKGAFKIVFEAFDTKHFNLVAWNQINRGNLKYDEYLNSVLLIKKLQHPSIIKLTGWRERDEHCHEPVHVPLQKECWVQHCQILQGKSLGLCMSKNCTVGLPGRYCNNKKKSIS